MKSKRQPGSTRSPSAKQSRRKKRLPTPLAKRSGAEQPPAESQSVEATRDARPHPIDNPLEQTTDTSHPSHVAGAGGPDG